MAKKRGERKGRRPSLYPFKRLAQGRPGLKGTSWPPAKIHGDSVYGDLEAASGDARAGGMTGIARGALELTTGIRQGPLVGLRACHW